MRCEVIMEIKSIFTEEAGKLLDSESILLSDELRQAAINEALRSRGEPVEVTASDVRKARQLFQKREIKLRPTTDLLLKFYMLLGVAIFIGGMGYPVLRDMMERTGMHTYSTSMISMSGLVISVVAYSMRLYLDALLKTRSRRTTETETKESQQ